MATVRLSPVAGADIARILVASEARWGAEARGRYEALLAAAIRQLAARPDGPLTRERNELARGLRGFHLRNARVEGPVRVRNPVHVIYYRIGGDGVIEIAAILHERMDAASRLNEEPE